MSINFENFDIWTEMAIDFENFDIWTNMSISFERIDIRTKVAFDDKYLLQLSKYCTSDLLCSLVKLSYFCGIDKLERFSNLLIFAIFFYNYFLNG